MPHEPIPCRLCGAPTVFLFIKTLMQTFDVAYFECTGCRSLQTEKPYWLERAYAKDSILDVGRAQRNVVTAMLCAHIFEKVGVAGDEPCLDWGGGEGLFCRFMRDRGFHCFTYDKYVRPLYSAPYAVDNAAALAPAAVTTFEVFEHLAEPARDLAAIFGLRPRFLICTTELYRGQGDDWMYLSTIVGRHVFFYSTQAMEWIAEKFGYRYMELPFLHAFVANDLWYKPELTAIAHKWNSFAALKDSLFSDAAQQLIGHLTGDAWRYVAADYSQIRKSNYGF